MYVHQKINPVQAILPRDITGLAQTSQWISLKEYRRVCIVITQGAWAGGTPAVTLLQAKDVAGTTPKALPFSKRWQQAWNTGQTGFVEAAVVNDTFQLPNTANQVHLLEIEAASLDVDNGYDCLQINIASPGVNADFLNVLYLCADARYADTKMPNALNN
jgi:hypothetical protein